MNATQTASAGSEQKDTTRTGSPSALTGSKLPDASLGGVQPSASNARSFATERQRTVQRTSPAAPCCVPVGIRSLTPYRLGLFLGGLMILAVIFYAGSRYLAFARARVKTDNAYLAAHIHLISSRVAGTVNEVLVEENQPVTAGMVVARLDPRDFEVRHQQALAKVAQAGAHAQECAAGIAQATAQITRERARATKASNDLARATSLFEGGSGAISRQELDLAKSESDAADAALLGAGSALDSAMAASAAAKAQQQVAEASLHEALLQLSYTEIVAPAAGRIGKKNLEVGNRLQPGQAVLALVEPEAWVSANFKETQLANLRPGQPVQIWVDAFPGRIFRGTVQSLAPGSGAQFALLPPDNATGNFTKIVQRVPVKVRFDRASLGDCEGRLVAGMSAVVEVQVSD